jgi:Ca2+-binding RTX toxin-like protein
MGPWQSGTVAVQLPGWNSAEGRWSMRNTLHASAHRGPPFAPDRPHAEYALKPNRPPCHHDRDHVAPPSFVPEARDGGMVVTALGNADAIGRNTFSDAAVEVQLYQRGLVSLTLGTLAFTAHALSGPGALAYATAETQVEAAGADVFIARTLHASGSGESAAGSWSAAATTTTFFAMDVQGFGLAGGPLISSTTREVALGGTDAAISGNLATFSVETQAFGDNTLNDVAVSALALEDQLSTVSVQVTMAGTAATGDSFRIGTSRGETMVAGNGSDWIFGGDGNDTILAGAGDNTLFGNAGNDKLQGGDGQDWVFGGTGRDQLLLGNGANIAFGGADNDSIYGGSGDDWIDAGAGDDLVQAGGGNNTIRMGGAGRAGDGNDVYAGGSGADWYLLNGAFGYDRITGFSVAQGDRLVAHAGDWDTTAGLNAVNGSTVWLARGVADARDLMVTMAIDSGVSVLVLDDFFGLNPGYAAPRFGALGDAAALPILQAIFEDGDTSAEAADRLAAFTLGDTLTMFA